MYSPSHPAGIQALFGSVFYSNKNSALVAGNKIKSWLLFVYGLFAFFALISALILNT